MTISGNLALTVGHPPGRESQTGVDLAGYHELAVAHVRGLRPQVLAVQHEQHIEPGSLGVREWPGSHVRPGYSANDGLRQSLHGRRSMAAQDAARSAQTSARYLPVYHL